MSNRSTPGHDTEESVSSAKRTLIFVATWAVRGVTALRLFVFYNGNLSPSVRVKFESLQRWWCILICLSLPLLPTMLRIVGMVSRKSAVAYELAAALYGHAYIVAYMLGIGSIWEGRVHFMSSYQVMSQFLALFEILRVVYEIGDAITPLPLSKRFAHHLAVYAVAYARVLHEAAEDDDSAGQRYHRIHECFAAVAVCICVLHLAAWSFTSMCSSLHQSQIFIQQQRDVYLGLLESATNGSCSVAIGGEESFQLSDLSPKLQSLLETSEQSIALKHVAKTHNDVQRMVSTCENLQTAGDPFIMTCLSQRGAQEEKVEFEVRVIPFCPPEGALKFCFMLASERRKLHTPTPSGSSESDGRRSRSASDSKLHKPHRKGLSVRKKEDSCPDDDLNSLLTYSISDATVTRLSELVKPRETRSIGTQTSEHPPRMPSQPCTNRAQDGSQAGSAQSASVQRTSSGSESVRASRQLHRSSSKSDSNSSGAQPGADRPSSLNVVGMLSAFELTEFQSQLQSMAWLAKHWNICRARGCCPFHMALKEMKHSLKAAMTRSQCQPLWSPLCGWQCTRCSCLNDDLSDMCDLCGSLKPNINEVISTEFKSE